MNTYLDILKEEGVFVEPDQSISYTKFSSKIARSIADCYYQVWGDAFPAKFMYDPIAIDDLYLNKGQKGGFAVTENGDVVGMFCAYTFHANPKLYEIGGLMVIPSYRGKVDLSQVIGLVYHQLQELDVDAILCQTVCHYLAAQKVRDKLINASKAVGVELGVFKYLEKGEIRRTSYIDTIELVKSESKKSYLTGSYREIATRIYNNLGGEMEFNKGSNLILKQETRLETFDYEDVLKIQIKEIGLDLSNRLNALDSNSDFNVMQVSVSIEDPDCEKALEQLNGLGYFFSSIIPYYDTTDCIILQKVKLKNPFKNVVLFTEESKEIYSIVIQDYERINK